MPDKQSGQIGSVDMWKKIGYAILAVTLSVGVPAAVTTLINNFIRSTAALTIANNNAAAMRSMAVSMDTLARNSEAQNKRAESIWVFLTYRADPWSGEMSGMLLDQLYMAMINADVHLNRADWPDEKKIQRLLEGKLTPPEFQDN